MQESDLMGDFSSESRSIIVVEVALELHGIFWFHTSAQPRYEKYAHISLPLIHNYPLLLAFLGRPVESAYASIPGTIITSINPEKVWREVGFYIYPAIKGTKIMSKTLTFSIAGTGYVSFKPKTRASVPDYTTNQVYLPGSEFKSYIIARNKENIPQVTIIRLGSKRYGTFRVKYGGIMYGATSTYGDETITHPFNAKDCPNINYHAILRHYAGPIAISGTPRRVIKAGNIVLAAPSFVGEDEN